MFPASDYRDIDDSLQQIVTTIETENPHLSVFIARKFRYSLRQNTVELTVKQPRQFNILEEFIIRAGLEFEPPPTANELASLLGLDPVFVKSTITTLQTLQSLAIDSQIIVTPEGRLFYEQGTVPQPPYTVEIQAITDSLAKETIFQSQNLQTNNIKLPDLENLLQINLEIDNISLFTLEKIQQMIQESNLQFHIPAEGKIVTAFKVIPPTQIVYKPISMFVIFDQIVDKFNMEIRSGEQILSAASNKLNSLLNQGQISLQSLISSGAK